MARLRRESDTKFEAGKEWWRPEELVGFGEKGACLERCDGSEVGGGLRGLLEGDDGCGGGGLLMSLATHGSLVVEGLVFGAVAAGCLAVTREVHAGCEAGDQHQQTEDSGEVT
jgi:hypothetical protein